MLFGWLLFALLLAFLLAWLFALSFVLLLATVFLFEAADAWLAGLLLLSALATVDACFVAGVDGPRACFGDMAGALYGAPADFAATTPLPLNTPGLAVAAITARP